jgi:uncharacterized protein YkwD
VGVSLGLVVLVGVFGSAYLVLSNDDVAIDGNQLGSAVATTEVTTTGNRDTDSFLAVSGDAGASRDSDDGALRVTTPESPSTAAESSTSAPSSSSTATTVVSSSTTAEPTTSSSSTTTTPATTAKPTTESTKPPTTAPPTTAETTTTKPSTTEATTTTRPATTLPPEGGGNDRAYEQRVIELTNANRRQAGCPDLVNNNKLHAAALAHSKDMAVNNYFSHTGLNGSSPGERIADQGYRFRGWAENIAAGYRTPESVVEGWMNSPGHRANILNCSLREIGVGFYQFYWTQNFGIPR